eukprot:IDg4136t1
MFLHRNGYHDSQADSGSTIALGRSVARCDPALATQVHLLLISVFSTRCELDNSESQLKVTLVDEAPLVKFVLLPVRRNDLHLCRYDNFNAILVCCKFGRHYLRNVLMMRIGSIPTASPRLSIIATTLNLWFEVGGTPLLLFPTVSTGMDCTRTRPTCPIGSP